MSRHISTYPGKSQNFCNKFFFTNRTFSNKKYLCLKDIHGEAFVCLHGVLLLELKETQCRPIAGEHILLPTSVLFFAHQQQQPQQRHNCCPSMFSGLRNPRCIFQYRHHILPYFGGKTWVLFCSQAVLSQIYFLCHWWCFWSLCARSQYQTRKVW